MRFRPYYFAQQQLTTYAPNGGYPGFYGAEEAESPLTEEERAYLNQCKTFDLACRAKALKAIYAARESGQTLGQSNAKAWVKVLGIAAVSGLVLGAVFARMQRRGA